MYFTMCNLYDLYFHVKNCQGFSLYSMINNIYDSEDEYVIPSDVINRFGWVENYVLKSVWVINSGSCIWFYHGVLIEKISWFIFLYFYIGNKIYQTTVDKLFYLLIDFYWRQDSRLRWNINNMMHFKSHVKIYFKQIV